MIISFEPLVVTKKYWLKGLIQKKMEIEKNDERNFVIANRRKAKAGRNYAERIDALDKEVTTVNPQFR